MGDLENRVGARFVSLNLRVHPRNGGQVLMLKYLNHSLA